MAPSSILNFHLMSLCKDGAFLMMGSENKKQNNLDIDTCTCKFTCIRGRNSLYNYIYNSKIIASTKKKMNSQFHQGTCNFKMILFIFVNVKGSTSHFSMCSVWLTSTQHTGTSINVLPIIFTYCTHEDIQNFI